MNFHCFHETFPYSGRTLSPGYTWTTVLTDDPLSLSLFICDRQQPYKAAALDQSPAYYEATTPSPYGDDELLVDGLPVGGFYGFAWNMISKCSTEAKKKKKKKRLCIGTDSLFITCAPCVQQSP